MKISIYISGITSVLLITIALLGVFMEYNPQIYFVAGLALLFLAFVPLLIVDKIRYNRKMNNIISNYKPNENREPSDKNKLTTQGWGMNNSPFRSRKSGLEWSGGNIKGTNAKRNNRNGFLN